MGSPEFAVKVLDKLIQGFNVVGVVTQPDRPAGRGKVLTPPPVKVLAEQKKVPVIQPERLRRPEAFEQLQAFAPDLIVVAAYGQILRPNVLELAQYGCINVHASLLPRWRGAAPIQAAILAGDEFSGVSIMKLDPGVDTGPVLAKREVRILPEDDSSSLGQRLAEVGADLLIETLPGYLNGSIVPQPQPEEGAAYAAMLKKEDGELDFDRPAVELERKIRAFSPWPGSFIYWHGQILKVNRARIAPANSLAAGQKGLVAGLPAIGTTDGSLVLEEVQPAGKKAMPGVAFIRGARNWAD